MVSMKNWNREKLEKIYNDFLGNQDADDPKVKKSLAIVAAASELFAVHGYRKTSMSQVAKQAGIAKGTLYLYFATKADLMVRVITEEKKQYLEGQLVLFDEKMAPRERLRIWLRTILTMAAKMPVTSRLMRGDREIMMVMAEMSTDMRDKTEEMRMDFLMDVIDMAGAPHKWTKEEVADRAKAFMGLIYVSGYFAEVQYRGGLELDRFAGILADMLVDGLAGDTKE
jgi:TetR/AcrR family transcriptional regulator, cholesterol catabolism regulator